MVKAIELSRVGPGAQNTSRTEQNRSERQQVSPLGLECRVRCSFPRAAIKSHRQLGGIKQQKGILLQFWRPRPEVQLSVALVLSGSSDGESIPCLSPTSGGCRQPLGVAQLVDAPPQPLPLSSQGLLPSVSFLLLIRTLVLD